MVRSFNPYCPVSTNPGTFVRSPKITTTNLDIPHYGLSMLFVKPIATATTYTLRGIITC
jgi:hypothetical protein